jgi:hypothetical protein
MAFAVCLALLPGSFHAQAPAAATAPDNGLPALQAWHQRVLSQIRDDGQAERQGQERLVRQLRQYRIRLLDLHRLALASDDDHEAAILEDIIAETDASVRAAEAALIADDQDTEQPSSPLPGGLEADLVLHLGFDGPWGSRVADGSGRGNHGRAEGPARTAPGRQGGAMLFDGAGVYVEIPSTDSLRIGRALTVSLLLHRQQPDGTNDETVEHLLFKGDGVSPDFWIQLAPNGAVGAGVGHAERPGTPLELPAEPASGRVDLGRWTHVVVTYDGMVMRTYVDGRRDKAVSLPGGIGTSDGPLLLGRGRLAPGRHGFRGRMDEVLVWRRALTEVEVLGLWAWTAADAGMPAAADHPHSHRAGHPCHHPPGHGDRGSAPRKPSRSPLEPTAPRRHNRSSSLSRGEIPANPGNGGSDHADHPPGIPRLDGRLFGGPAPGLARRHRLHGGT